MKIISLTAENVKRLKAIEIHPDANDPLVEITGRNAQGKTSVLDAIWLALGGGAASRDTVKPVRDGEESAHVILDLGDLTVTRTWKSDGRTTLKVANADGSTFSSPQSMLDELVGRLSFDPLAFTRLSARDQLAALLDLVVIDLDIEANAAERARIYDARTDVGRELKALGEILPPDTSLPETEQSAAELLDKIDVAHKRSRLADLIEDQKKAIRRMQSEVAENEKQLADLGPAIDVAALTEDLHRVEEVNRGVRENDRRKRLAERAAELSARRDSLTERIEFLDTEKSKALAAAKFPVDGLGFNDDGVTYHGLPFSQASAAEQIKVSLSMAMAANPKLRVIRILDGSLLDSEALATIREVAGNQDYQVWIERVSDGTGLGIVIEDGQVQS